MSRRFPLWAAAADLPPAECRADGRFIDLQEHRFRLTARCSTERYLAFLTSISLYRMLSADRRERVLDDTAAALSEHGGGIELLQLTDLFSGPAGAAVNQARSTWG